MDTEEVLKKLKIDFAHRPNIPQELYQYVEKAVRLSVRERLIPAMTSEGNERIPQNIDDLFAKAMRILKCNTDQIMKGLDFHPNDIGKGRIDALFAELRTVVWLDLMGFDDIQLLKSKKKKQADILASYSDLKWAVEVFCSTQASYRWPDHSNSRLDMFQDFIVEANTKRPQLDNTAIQHGCDRKLLVMILDSNPALALLERSDYAGLLQRVARELNWGDDYHFAIITGGVSLREGPDDVVYPAL